MQKLGSNMDFGQEAILGLAGEGLPDLLSALPEAAASLPEAPSLPASATPAKPASRKQAGADDLMPPPELKAIYDRVAAEKGVPVNVLVAMGHTESGHRPDIDGPQTRYGAAGGIMQYLPATAAAHKINRYNPEESIRQAADDLRARLAKNGGDMANAVARHHAGDNPDQLGPKSRDYAQTILAKARRLAPAYEAEQAAQLKSASKAREASREQAAESKRGEYYPPGGAKPAEYAMPSLAGNGLFGFSDQLQQSRQAAPYGDLGVMNGFKAEDTPAAQQRSTTPITPEAEAQVRAALTTLPALQRQVLLQDKGWRGQVARTIWAESEDAKRLQRNTGVGPKLGDAAPIITRDEIETSYRKSGYTPEQAAQLAMQDLAGHTDQVRASNFDFEGMQAARDSLLVQAGRDVKRGASNLRAMSEGLAGTVYGLMGDDDAARSALEVATARMEKTARENPALVGSYENIHGADDAVRYAVEAVAENLPMFLPSMASGGAGGLVARKAAQGIVGDMVAKVGRDRALKELERRIMLGQTTGSAAASVGMETGSIAGDIYQKTGRAEPWLALAAGIPAGMLDAVEPVMALRRIAGPAADGVAGSIIKRLGVESGKQFMAEAGTEGLQTIIENAAGLAAQNKQPFTPEILDGVVDAMLKGGIGGGVMGAGSEAIAHLRSGRANGSMVGSDYQRAVEAAFGSQPEAQGVPAVPAHGPIGRAVSKAAPASVAADDLDRPPVGESMYESADTDSTGVTTGTLAWGDQPAAELARQPVEVGRKENFAADYPLPPAPDPAAIADVDARVAATREQDSAAQRRQILDGVLSDSAVRNPVAKFSAELARAGYAQAVPSADELATIERFSAAKDTFASIDPDATPPAPAAPNTMGDDDAVDWRAQRDAEIMGEDEGDGQAQPSPQNQSIPQNQQASAGQATEQGSETAKPSAPQGFTQEQAAIADQSRAANQFIKLLRKAGQPVNDERAMVALWKAHKANATGQQSAAPTVPEAPPEVEAAKPAPVRQDSSLPAPLPEHQQPAVASNLPKQNNWHKKAAQVDIERDTVRDAVARLGGIRKDEAMREWGATLVEGAKSRIFGKPVFRAKGGAGMPLDKMREALAELGYLPPDSDINDLYQAFERDGLHHVGQERRAATLAQQAATASQDASAREAAATPEQTLDSHPVYDPWYDFDPDTILPDDLNEAASEAGEMVSDDDASFFEHATAKLHHLVGADETEALMERAAIMADSGKNFFEAVLELINGRQEAENQAGATAATDADSYATETSAGRSGAGTQTDVQQSQSVTTSTTTDQLGDAGSGILQSYDQAELDAREQARRAADAHRKEEDKAADRKRQADAEVGDFVLTGSDSMADQLAARGQGGLFDAPSNAPNIDQVAPNSSASNLAADEAAPALEETATAKANEQAFPTKEIADSYRHISHRGSDRAKAEESAFNQSIEHIRSEIGVMAETEAQRAAFDSAMADYQRGYIDASLKVARAREGTMSPLVAGRNNFNGKQAARTGGAYEKAQDEFARKVGRLKAAVEEAVRDARTPKQIQAEQVKAAEKARKKSILDFAKAAGAIADDLRNDRKAMAGDTRKWANKDMMALLDGMDEATQRQAIEGSDKALKELGGVAVVVGPRSALGKRVTGILSSIPSSEDAQYGSPLPDGARRSVAEAEAEPVIDQLDTARGESAATAQTAPATDEGSVDAGVSRNDRSESGESRRISVENARAIKGRILANVSTRTRDKVRVVPSVAMLPPQVRQWLDKEVNQDDHDIPAVYWNGNTYIIAENIRDEAHLEEALLHELMGHYGVRVLFGAETDVKLRQLFEDIGGWKGYLNIADALGLTQRLMPYYLDFKESQRLNFVMMDELLGHMAGLRNWPLKPLHVLIGRLKAYLRKMGFKSLPAHSTSDLAALLAKAQSMVIAGDDRANPVEKSQRASLGAASIPALTVADLQEVFRQSPLGSWVDRLIASGRLTIKPNLVLPEGYKHLEATQAFTVDGNITMFAGNIGGRQRVMPVLLHEIFHSSGEALLGSKEWGKLIAELDQLRQHAEANPAGKAGKLWGDARRRVQDAIESGDNMSQADMAEELGAYAIELADQAPLTWQRWADRAIGHVKAWVRRVFGTQLGRLTPEELRAMAVAALKAGKETSSASPKASMQLSKPLFGQRQGLFDLPPIEAVELSGEEFGAGLSKKELARAADALLREIQHAGTPLHNDDTGWDLVIGKKNRKKLGDNPDLTANDHKAIAQLAELVSRAVVGETHPDIKHGNEDVQAVHRLYAPVRISGSLLRVKLTVKDYLLNDGTERKNLHAIEAVEIENAPMGTVTTTHPKNEEWRSQPTSGRNANIAHNLSADGQREIENAPMGTLPTKMQEAKWTTQPTSGRLVSIEALMAGAKRDADAQPFVRFSMRGKDPVSIKEGNFPGADARDSNIALGRDAQRRLVSEHPTWAQRLRDVGLKGLRPTLSILPGNTVVDLYRDKLPALELAQKHGERLDGMRQTLQKEADEAFRAWEKLPADAADKMADLMHEATIWQLHPDQPAPDKLSKKWAAKHAQLADDWAALPAEAKAVYREVRDLYAKRTEQMFDALADRIGRMSGLGTGARSKMLADLRERFDKTLGEGPYFPLSRFGDYLVVAKRLDSDGKTLEKVVLAAETEHEQRMLQQDLLGRGFDVVELDKAAKNFRASSLGTDLSGFAAGLIDKLDGVEMSDDQRADILDDINQMLIDALPPASARKHFKHRKGVPGFSNDAVRAFVRSQASMASHIANITYQDRIDKALQDARKQAKQDQANVNELGSVVDEMEERAELARRFVAHPIANALTQLGFANFLGFSLSQGLLNLTQVPLLTYPALAAKFGEAKTHAAMRGAYAKVGRALTKKGGETWGDVRTLDDLDDDSRRILKAMEERGKLDLTMALDLVRGGAGPQAPGRHVATRAAQWVGRYSGWFNHISEAANRQVTAIAGYKLALGQGMSRDQAVDYVAKLLDDSQFNYAFSNRPRLLMSNAGRVIGLMHTFAINAMYRIGRNLYHAMGDWRTKEGQEARSIMLRILTVQTAMAGLSSLPLLPLAGAAMGTVVHKATGSRVLGTVGVMAGVGLAQALVSGMGADDDEPWDFDAERRRILNDITGSRTAAELLDKGLLRALGMDVANRISMNDLLMRDVDTGFTSKPAQTWLDNAFLQSIGGAAYGAIKQYARATDMAMDGQYYRGMEATLPKFASDVLKAVRYAHEGVRVPVGPATAHKADVTAYDVAKQALGFTPSTVAEVNSSERAQRKAVAQMQARRGELLESWIVARLEKDADAEKDAVERIAKFNRTQQENGSVDLVITGADRMSKLRSQKRSVERRESGKLFGKKYRGIAENAGGMYGEE